VQFVTVSLFTIPSFLSWSAGAAQCFLKAPVIPLKSWVIYTVFFVTVNLLNNWAFAYRISVPLHIILRSGGPTASMIIGYLYNGRRYSRMQIFSVMLLTLGVVAAALADAKAQGRAISLKSSSPDDENSTLTFITGFTILALAMLLSSFQGVYADRLYATHGNTHWREALLYSHMLSLPFFLPTYAQLSSQLRAFLASPSMLADIDQYSAAASVFSPRLLLTNGTVSNATLALSRVAAPSLTPSPTPLPAVIGNSSIATLANHTLSTLLATHSARQSFSHVLNALLAATPSKIFYLLVNALTQYICIRGVYLLAAKSSSLTVTIVLNIRKLVSLLLSIYIFGNSLAAGVLIGAGFVFLGGALYGVGSARAKAQNSMMTLQQHQNEGRQHRRRILEKVSSGYSSLRERSPRRRKVKV
jgi:solute carrier family 35 (UDP-xylose/UDP-N-acetylglucosamine transporter), member B4